jgi:phosphotransferase system enzyme I (PtsI)
MRVPGLHSSSDADGRFVGLPISEGVAVGRVCLFNEWRHASLPVYAVGEEGRKREEKRLENAITLVIERIDALAYEVADRVGSAEAEIFRAQKVILQDPSVTEQMKELVGAGGVNAELAVTRTLDDFESRIQEVDNEYLKERATDIGEIRRRLLDALGNMKPSLQCAGEERCQRGRDRIIVAEELTPSLTVELDTKHTIGFVTERGGPTSHAAILARALGIPAVSGIAKIHSLLSCGTRLLVDGHTGRVVVWPGKETLAQYPALSREPARMGPVVEPVPGLQVMANISLASDVSEAVRMKAEGIGMYRTEYEFIGAGHLLDEEEQLDRYLSVVEAMHGQPVTFRLLDIGGDKATPFLNLPEETNPYLGLRGSRLLLARPELFRAQARAVARVSNHGPVSVLYPMIVDLRQFLAVKKILLDHTSDLPTENLRHGVMFEVPSACLEAREILEVADFGSIGSNDLVQYLFAADRNNEHVAQDCDPDRSVFWSLIRALVSTANDLGRPLSVCGEAAGNPALLAKFMDAGLRTVSVSARLIPELRLAVR